MLRRNLQARLDLIPHRPLCLVSAPAGYGKTTAVSAWLEKSDLYGAWLSLDEIDNDFMHLLTGFLAAVRRRTPGFGTSLGSILRQGNPLTTQEFVNFFFSELDALDRGVILVLEDLHLIHNPEALELISDFMRYPHPKFHLVLLSRHDPRLPLSVWRARNQLIDIRSADLRFNLEETTAFLKSATDDSPNSELIANLHTSTEGWPAGLRLAALSLAYSKKDVEEYFHDLSAANHHIVEFLTEQVLAGLTAEMQSFMIQTSILNRMSGPLCEAVIASSDAGFNGQAMLRKLNRENLFIIALDDEQQWFRYHHLLGGFLKSKLNQAYSDKEIALLHLRAGRWFAEAGFTEAAIQHLMIAGEIQEAVDLVTKIRQDLLNQESFGRLLSLCNLFPDEVVQASPDLLLAKAWGAHATRLDIGELRRLAEEIDTLIDHLDLEPSQERLLRAENDILAGIPLYYTLDPSTSLARSTRGLEFLPKTYYTVRSFARVYGAGSLHLMGELDSAYEMVRLGQQEDLAMPGGPRGRNAGTGGYISWMMADLTASKQIGEYLLTLTLSVDQHITKAWGHYFLASAHYHQNNLTEALHHAESAFSVRLMTRGYFSIYTGFILALVHQANGNLEKVREIMAQVIAYAIELRSLPHLSTAQAFQVELDIRQGHFKQAAQWAEQMLPNMRLGPFPFFYAPPLTIPKALLGVNSRASDKLAADTLQRLHEHVEATHNNRFLIEVLALEAMLYDRQGDEETAIKTLERSLIMAEPSEFIRLYVDLGPKMRELLGRVPSSNPRAGYIQRILSAFSAVKATANEAMVEPLTERELQVLDLLVKRLSNKEIAQQLVIAPVTVKRHTINIYQKLNVASRREAVQAAQHLGIIEKPPAG